jgi:predicted TIM-barrel fold metal-dependent hydrolase
MPADRLLREMAAVGVDAAIIVTPSIYGYDNGYPLEVARAIRVASGSSVGWIRSVPTSMSRCGVGA